MKRSVAAATMRVSKRRFGVQEVRPAVGRTAVGGSASGAVADAADAVFAEAKAFLRAAEAGQMSQSDLERELDRRRLELVGSLVQACRDERNRERAAGPVEQSYSYFLLVLRSRKNNCFEYEARARGGGRWICRAVV